MNVTKKLARTAGFLYLIMIITGGFAEAFVRGGLTVDGDPAATARNVNLQLKVYH